MEVRAKGWGRWEVAALAGVGLLMCWLLWNFVVLLLSAQARGVSYSAPVTWRMAGMAREPMLRAISAQARPAAARGEVLLRPDDPRRGHGMRSQGTLLVVDGGREILRCRYDPAWPSGFSLWPWPLRVDVSECSGRAISPPSG